MAAKSWFYDNFFAAIARVKLRLIYEISQQVSKICDF